MRADAVDAVISHTLQKLITSHSEEQRLYRHGKISSKSI